MICFSFRPSLLPSLSRDCCSSPSPLARLICCCTIHSPTSFCWYFVLFFLFCLGGFLFEWPTRNDDFFRPVKRSLQRYVGANRFGRRDAVFLGFFLKMGFKTISRPTTSALTAEGRLLFFYRKEIKKWKLFFALNGRSQWLPRLIDWALASRSGGRGRGWGVEGGGAIDGFHFCSVVVR